MMESRDMGGRGAWGRGAWVTRGRGDGPHPFLCSPVRLAPPQMPDGRKLFARVSRSAMGAQRIAWRVVPRDPARAGLLDLVSCVHLSGVNLWRVFRYIAF